jgi:hypothetical protein
MVAELESDLQLIYCIPMTITCRRYKELIAGSIEDNWWMGRISPFRSVSRKSPVERGCNLVLLTLHRSFPASVYMIMHQHSSPTPQQEHSSPQEVLMGLTMETMLEVVDGGMVSVCVLESGLVW